MLWKSVTALIVLLWAVMTFLLVRETYFPEESRLTEVSVNTVLERAAQHRNLTRNTLTLTRNGVRLGHADVSVLERKDESASAPLGFTWQAGGLIEGKSWGVADGSAVWRFDGDVNREQGWERISLAVRIADTDTNLLVGWKKGDDMPKIELKRRGELIMNTEQALDQAKSQQGGGAAMGLMGMLPGFLGKQTVSLERLIQLQAHRGHMQLAGEERKSLQLTLSLLGFYQAKLSYTEAGELARIELPQGWQLTDPLLTGLVSGTR